MRVKRVEVRMFKKVLSCSRVDCPGFYEATGNVIIIPSTGSDKPNPPVYAHKCTVCSDEQNLETRFPYLEHEEI